MTTIHVRPADGRTVLDERTGLPIPTPGAELELTRFVRRRLAEGDLEVVESNSIPAESASSEDEPAVTPEQED